MELLVHCQQLFSDQAQMRTAIQNERRYELAMEGERFYDLVRWGLAPTVHSALGYQNKNIDIILFHNPQFDFSGGVLVQNPEWP